MVLERTATARAVEDRNQEFKSDRADVREMEGSLERGPRQHRRGRQETSRLRA